MSAAVPNVIVDFWNVGQGDASSILMPSGELILIDVGPKNSTMSQWLRSGKNITISGIILTHNDTDHAGALLEILHEPRCKVEKVYFLEDRSRKTAIAKKLISSLFKLHEKGLSIVALYRDDLKKPRILWEDSSRTIKLLLLHPNIIQAAKSKSHNSASAVLALCVHDSNIIVWGGDASLSCVAKATVGVTQWLFGPHHGAPQDPKQNRKNMRENISTLSPCDAFISVGSTNGHKHPTPQYIIALRKKHCRVNCTQMTSFCNSARVSSQSHLMNTSGYFGLPAPFTGVFCRGHVRLNITPTGEIIPDEYHVEHLRLLIEEKRNTKRLLCLK